MNEIFAKYNFKPTKETTKAIEYEHIISKDVIYALATKGIGIVLHPDTAESLKLTGRSDGFVHNTALSRFPRRKNDGKTYIHYGSSFKFQSEEQLDEFINGLGELFKNR
ncbi:MULTISPECIES: hypothetical protein [Metabacillus]|uniref:Uncharacterized protein n=1 Tax=Metabacillus hrfriensis TaxID=3048891 RepID=A0ACD4RCK0_9BACI|nr:MULTISPECIES: hypothetical protein [Metabacillus]UAL52677.1 hypothetical protein K8L98_02215 [Metabacillus dongyingensis]WHZ58211.1 hypothetical protein QLQ22_02230 [Metabacillus sp. CT-WN-B3]